jgi:hypothetical protein
VAYRQESQSVPEVRGAAKEVMKESISIDETIDLLNSALNLDRKALSDLIAGRVVCNEVLADHETIQVGNFNGELRVGLLGILNGLFGIDAVGWGPISAVLRGDGLIKKFERLSLRRGVRA